MSKQVLDPPVSPRFWLQNLLHAKFDLYDLISQMQAKYGNVGQMDLGIVGRPYWIINPEDCHHVLSLKDGSITRSDRFQDFDILGLGVILQSGETHRRLVKALSIVFRGENVSKYMQDVITCTQIMLSRWRKSKQKTINIAHESALLTLDITRSLLDNSGVLTREQHQLIADTFRAAILYIPGKSILKKAAPMAAPMAYFKYRNGKPQVQTLTRSLVSQRLDQKHIPDMLGLILQSYGENKLASEEEVADQVITLYFAMYDTVKWLISAALRMVARNPEIQAKIAAEDNLPGRETPLMLDHLQGRPFLQATIKEVLRLYPAIWNIPLQVNTEVLLPSGYRLLPGNGAFLSIGHAQRDPRYWDNPHAALPERMLNGGDQNMAYYPFGIGDGGRMCLAPNLIDKEAPLILGNILHQVDVKPLRWNRETIESGAGFTFTRLGLKVDWK
jgi:enediyne biosynthesis protein E7